MRIEITEIENHNSYRVWHDAAVLIERTTSPMCAAPASFWREVPPGLTRTDATRWTCGPLPAMPTPWA
jgi:hypothetical protein